MPPNVGGVERRVKRTRRVLPPNAASSSGRARVLSASVATAATTASYVSCRIVSYVWRAVRSVVLFLVHKPIVLTHTPRVSICVVDVVVCVHRLIYNMRLWIYVRRHNGGGNDWLALATTVTATMRDARNDDGHDDWGDVNAYWVYWCLCVCVSRDYVSVCKLRSDDVRLCGTRFARAQRPHLVDTLAKLMGTYTHENSRALCAMCSLSPGVRERPVRPGCMRVAPSLCEMCAIVTAGATSTYCLVLTQLDNMV